MPRPLPWTAADRWATRYGFADPDRFEWLWDRLSGLDRAYLAVEAARLDAEIAKLRNK